LVIDLHLSVCEADSGPDVFTDKLPAHFKSFIHDTDTSFIVNLSDEVYLPISQR